MKSLRLLLILLLIPFLIPVVFLAGLIFVPVILIDVFWFRLRNHGKKFLVYTSRHGWNEFVVNNLIPAMEHTAVAVQIRRGRYQRWSNLEQHIHIATSGLQKPLIAAVYWRGVYPQTLHGLLLPLKKHGARNATLQQQLRELVEHELTSV
jgi:hypothetical protein